MVDLEEDELKKRQTIEQLVVEMKCSGYDQADCQETVISGVRGLKTKIETRRKQGSTFYRTGKQTLKNRIRKKLTAKTSWYRDQKNGDEKVRVKTGKITKKQNTQKNKIQYQNKIKSIIFMPCTEGGVLVKKTQRRGKQIV